VQGRTPAEARQLARRRAENVTRAYKQLQPTEIKLETTSSIYEDNKMSREASNDFVVVQFHPDYEALKLPDCNPVPIPGFKR
jgi:CDP-glycerol glycerophosphotransferase (TagB/SpsB family)